MSEELIVRHCSPTLAGMKTGNMFTCFFADAAQMRKSLRGLNQRLRKKGLRIIPLRFNNNRALVYIYRPTHLLRDLQHREACRLLRERGYSLETPNRCLVHLKRRLGESGEFPHEIGLFLGYPPEDVAGFIDNREEDCKFVGCWKVYGDEKAAQKTFAKYQKCTDVYCAKWAAGSTIERLTVAVS